jgi:hypothetical protein
VRELVAGGEDVYGVRVVTSTLEDAYLDAVAGADAGAAALDPAGSAADGAGRQP